MKKAILLLCIAFLITSSCSSSNNSSGSNSLSNIMQVLNAKWALQSIAGQNGLGDLFGDQMPFLQFDTQASRVSGNNSCNSLAGPLIIEAGNKISFANMVSTRKACPGQGESVFMNALNKVTNFKVDNGVLKLLNQGEEVMSFIKGDN
jgi:heat shock protein HslJ